LLSAVVVRRPLKLVPAVPEHDPLLSVRRTARSVRHVPLPGRPDRLAGDRRLGERLGSFAEQLSPPESDQRLERTPEVTVDHDTDDWIDKAAGEDEAHSTRTRLPTWSGRHAEESSSVTITDSRDENEAFRNENEAAGESKEYDGEVD